MMTVEQVLLSGIGAVTAALVFVCKILWNRSEGCEADRRALRQEIEDVKTNNGQLSGFTQAVGACDKQGCGLAKVARAISESQQQSNKS
jgi:hypothetical protein